MSAVAEDGRPWKGRSYAHLMLPYPHLDARAVALVDAAVLGAGSDEWVALEDNETAPLLWRRWRHRRGRHLVAVVLSWYPLLLTVGPEGRDGRAMRAARRRIVDAVAAAGGRIVADTDLDPILAAAQDRWGRVLAARRRIEQQRFWVECRRCAACDGISGYAAVHCRICGRRFTAEDDTEREEAGRAAREVIAAAESELSTLGRGDQLLAGPVAAAAPPSGGRPVVVASRRQGPL